MTDFLTKLKAMSRRYGDPNALGTPGTPADPDRPDGSQIGDGKGKVAPSSHRAGHLQTKLQSQQASGHMAQISEPLENYAELPKLKRPLYQRWWAWSIVSIGFGIGGAVIAAQTTLVSIERDLPDTSEALTYVRNGTLTIKASDGTVLQQLGPATRDKVTLEQMPDRLPEAFIASEDEDFYEHDGVNYRSIARAFFKNLTAGEVIEGGSTITQQLARIVFLDQERSLGRKVKEALLAQKMERELDKDQILERYLNLVYLGSGAYGVADAAWIFFSKKVDELTLSESAMIAGMAPAPSVYSPLVNPDLAKQRRDIVLQRMVDAGFITESERISAVAEPIALKPGTPKNLYSEVPYFTSYIQQQLPQYVSPEQLELGGLTIETTLNLQWQKQAQDVVKDAIANYGPYEGFEQAALVCIDPRTGEIKALVGGDDFEKSQFNRATQAQRQPGSTFKTLVYSTAIAGGISPYAGYVDAKLVVDGYEPQNYGRSYRGSVTLRDALTSSINIVAVKTLIDVGFDPVIQMAKRMGIQSELIPAYSLALGSSEVNLLELTSAYGTLANKGNHVEVHGITRIIDRYGNVVYEAKFTPEQAIDADSASIMTWMLEEVVRSGTGWEASLPDRPVAGKTGTSENRRDLWFIGYVPQLVTGVWLGNDDSSPTYGASSTAARTWYDFMITLTDEVSAEQFPDIPAVDGREPTIELQPVKPGRISESSTASSEESTWEDGNYSGYDSGYSSTSEPSPSASPTEGDASSGESPPTEASADPASSEPPPPIDEGIPEPPIVDSAPPPPILDQPPPISEPPPVVVPVETAPEPLPLPGGADN